MKSSLFETASGAAQHMLLIDTKEASRPIDLSSSYLDITGDARNPAAGRSATNNLKLEETMKIRSVVTLTRRGLRPGEMYCQSGRVA